MELQPENQENIIVEDQPIVEEKPKKNKTWLFILIGVFLLATIFALGWLCYKNGCFKTEQTVEIEEEIDEPEIEEEEEEEKPRATKIQAYTGTFFSTKHPTGWRIVEYLDGDGSDMLYDEEDYSGLTGLKIFNGLKEIFYMKGVTGIGFIGCPQLARFADYNADYEQEQQDMNDEIGMETEILDYTSTNYSAFKWFSKDFRRVGSLLFYDVLPNILGGTYFEPQCETMFLPITEFVYTDSYGYESNAYLYTISESATEDELKKLDEILANMVLKP